jgi:CRISPR type III-A-associated protein Csm2
MPDMRDAMKKVGLSGGQDERKCDKCGKVFVPKEPHHRTCSECFQKRPRAPRGAGSRAKADVFAPGYPDYFDPDGTLKCEYLTDRAERIAEAFGRAKPKLTPHQLRAFYQHVKRQQGALKNGRPFREVLVEICKLKPFATERAEKEKIPDEFREFICRNVDKVKDEKAFLEGFVEHFQAVVAYCAGTIQER